MADTPNTGETASQGNDSNDVSQITAPVTDNSSADLGNLQKELEQLRMRNNQLSNQLTDKQRAEEQAKQKQLEEKEEFKTLYEQTQQRLDELQSQSQLQEKQRKLEIATEELLKEYPQEVQELAKTAGLGVSDDTDEARNSLKEKLDAFKARVGTGNTVTPNNGYTPPTGSDNRNDLVKREHPGGESPMALAGARGDDSVTLKYISQIPAIQRLKQLASEGA